MFLLSGCGCDNQTDNILACKEACAPNGVKQYSEDSGCICNRYQEIRVQHEEKEASVTQ